MSDKPSGGGTTAHGRRKADLSGFTERIAHTLAARDCSQVDKEVPKDDHDLWNVWNSSALSVVEELRRELEALLAYERTINWMTTCSGCAQTFDSCYTETVRRAMAELTLKEVEEWAHSSGTRSDPQALLRIVENGRKRSKRNLGEDENGTIRQIKG